MIFLQDIFLFRMIKQYFSTGVLISKACKKGATISEQQAKKKFRFLDPVELNMKSSFAGKEMLTVQCQKTHFFFRFSDFTLANERQLPLRSIEYFIEIKVKW